MPYVKELTGGTGVWMGHKIDDSSNVRFTPAYVNFECDNMLLMMDREPIDQSDVTSLVYMSMKPTDYAAHRWGLESLEAREALRAQDACVGKLIQKLNCAGGREQLRGHDHRRSWDQGDRLLTPLMLYSPCRGA